MQHLQAAHLFDGRRGRDDLAWSALPGAPRRPAAAPPYRIRLAAALVATGGALTRTAERLAPGATAPPSPVPATGRAIDPHPC